jgi:hypothetical protein
VHRSFWNYTKRKLVTNRSSSPPCFSPAFAADGDLTNAEKFSAGTEPNNSVSVLKIDQLKMGGTVQVTDIGAAAQNKRFYLIAIP